MHCLIGLIFFSSLASNELMISYFDKVNYSKSNIELNNIIPKFEKKDVDRGFMLSISYPINPQESILCLLGATSISRWEVPNDESYAYSTYLAARFAPFSLFGISIFGELSIAGPTYLSKKDLGTIDFGSNIVYQNYIGVGIKAFSLVADIKMINYSPSLPTAFTKNSTTLPLIISIGLTY